MRTNGRNVLLGMGLLMFPAALLAAPPARDTVEAITAPSDERKLSFNFPGLVKQVLVKEGEVVKEGQPLMLQDDDIEQAELERLKREADSQARIAYYEADRDLKRTVSDYRNTAPEGAFSKFERDQAKAELIQSEKQIDVANLDHEGEKTKAKQQGLKVQKMTIQSRIDGIVLQIGVKGGEFAEIDRDKPAIVIVKNDPAWVEIKDLKSWQVAHLRANETMQVRYPGEKDWMSAKIVFISPTTFPGTDNQLVRLELPNPQNKATGLAIEVKLPQKLVAQTDRTANR